MASHYPIFSAGKTKIEALAFPMRESWEMEPRFDRALQFVPVLIFSTRINLLGLAVWKPKTLSSPH
jgi:hypothetical protein